jgi:transcriptional regulator with XRE-family HTH domain
MRKNRRELLVDFGNNLFRLRIKKGVTQAEMAYYAGVTRSSIGQYERGNKFPDITTLTDMARGLGVPVGNSSRPLRRFDEYCVHPG